MSVSYVQHTLLFACAGDLAYYDETEHIFIVDKLKDVIKFQTMQVYDYVHDSIPHLQCKLQHSLSSLYKDYRLAFEKLN